MRTWGVMEAANNLREYLCAFKSIVAVFCLSLPCPSAAFHREWSSQCFSLCFFRIPPGAVVHSEHLKKKKKILFLLFSKYTSNIKRKGGWGWGGGLALQHSEQVCLRVNKCGHTRVHGGLRRPRTDEYSASSCCLHSVLLNL